MLRQKQYDQYTHHQPNKMFSDELLSLTYPYNSQFDNEIEGLRTMSDGFSAGTIDYFLYAID
jgi:hypothetical protein